MACQIDAASLPSPQIPPIPVTTMRCRIQAGFLDQAAHGLDHVLNSLQIAPGLDRVHLDLDAVGLFEIEDDLRQFEGMDAERGKFRIRPDFADFGIGMRLDLGDDVVGKLVSHRALPEFCVAPTRVRLRR